MGAKGKKRREKNYKAAHGGYSGLPPPPDPSKLDALPSKIRQIMSFTQSQQKHLDNKHTHHYSHAQNNIPLKDKGGLGTANGKVENTNEQLKESYHGDSDYEQLMQSSENDKKKKKRKRKEVKDLRFAMEPDKTSSQLKRKERKKKYLEAKKKKKQKKSHEEDELDFPGHEKIKFGDIVQAPPKLAVIPRAFKNAQDASQERLRLRAIEEYRNRKGWKSRPGSHLPPSLT
ncbi:hypothetical protein HN51_005620 [Arachis hypogaea]|uniref:Uncharacterized protein n=1 Tax=Arachis hypogaea TaxID=3818 RepID=A0A445DDZ1_ARAHY|nr:protein PXR1 [Arachis hypogaea]QHO39394.1 uncharacterized protein DS421_4g128760 [Arachis hypogaea]RYR61365.1 hypothetical protein Ahy_A04g018535 isoform A [Arachis hypogaea]RYR61366.1 hypothetical protein Ahy_A04g018535 isoform B [Arachis hypogaea]